MNNLKKYLYILINNNCEHNVNTTRSRMYFFLKKGQKNGMN